MSRRMVSTTVYLTQELTERLKMHCKASPDRSGIEVPMASVIRLALGQYLDRAEKATIHGLLDAREERMLAVRERFAREQDQGLEAVGAAFREMALLQNQGPEKP